MRLLSVQGSKIQFSICTIEGRRSSGYAKSSSPKGGDPGRLFRFLWCLGHPNGCSKTLLTLMLMRKYAYRFRLLRNTTLALRTQTVCSPDGWAERNQLNTTCPTIMERSLHSLRCSQSQTLRDYLRKNGKRIFLATLPRTLKRKCGIMNCYLETPTPKPTGGYLSKGAEL